jgi:hypothetical protein
MKPLEIPKMMSGSAEVLMPEPLFRRDLPEQLWKVMNSTVRLFSTQLLVENIPT